MVDNILKYVQIIYEVVSGTIYLTAWFIAGIHSLLSI